MLNSYTLEIKGMPYRFLESGEQFVEGLDYNMDLDRVDNQCSGSIQKQCPVHIHGRGRTETMQISLRGTKEL